LCPLVTGWPSYTLRHRVPFSSPSATRRTTVGVLQPASTREVRINMSNKSDEVESRPEEWCNRTLIPPIYYK
jgi:hypothetical protein